jgi:hypothetical protein
MYLSILVTNEVVLVPWTIIQQDEDITFSALFEHVRCGSFINIVPTQHLTNCNLEKVYVGISREQFSVVEFSHSVVSVCDMFGQFIKFVVEVEFDLQADPTCSNRID